MTQTKKPHRETVFARIIVATSQVLFHFMKRFPSIPLLLVCCVEPGIAIVRGGEIITHQFDSQKLAGNLIGESPTQTFMVYLPDGYDEGDRRYPVVYWIPGGNVSPMWGISAGSIDEAIRSGRVPPTIIAFMPKKTEKFASTIYLSSDVFGDWEGFFTTEVIPLIDDTYRTYGTSQQRGIMGMSSGGFPALTLPILHPDTWGAVGANDPSSWLIPVNAHDWPDGVIWEGTRTETAWRTMPTSLEDYGHPGVEKYGIDAHIRHQLFAQIGARFSPNPDSPYLFDSPRDLQGQPVPDVRAKWSEFDIFDSNVLSNHTEALQDLSMVSIITREDQSGLSARLSRELIETLQTGGINAKFTVGVGGHSANHEQRFISLLEDVVGGMASSLAWDENGPGNWDDHRWVGPLDYPSGNARVVVRSDAVTVATDGEAASLVIESGEVLVRERTTLTLFDWLEVQPGASLVFAVGDTSAGRVAVAGDVELDPQSELQFLIDGSSPFKAGDYPLITADGELTGTFGSSTGLGHYVSSGPNLDGLTYADNTLTVTIDKGLHPGDADLSTTTDLSDFNVWNANKFTSDTGWRQGDLNGDGVTDLSDFNVWNANKFTMASGGAAPAPGQVPEPGTIAMLTVCGLLGLLLAAARHRRIA